MRLSYFRNHSDRKRLSRRSYLLLSDKCFRPGGGDSQFFGAGMLVVPLRGKNSWIWYCLGCRDKMLTLAYGAVPFRASSDAVYT